MATNNYTEKEALLVQVEELKAELQSEKERNVSQGQKVSELSKNLESKEKENKTLWEQVEYLTNELNKGNKWVKEQGDLLRKERARCLEEERKRIKFGQELEKVKENLANEKIQEELCHNKEKEARRELETLKVSLEETKQRYETELGAEREKNKTLQQQMTFQETIQRLEAEQDAFRQEMEQKVKLMLQEASEREKCLHREMEDLKINLNQQLTTKVEEQVSVSVQNLKEELTKQQEEEEEEEEPLPAVESPELLTEAPISEEKAPEQKKKKGFRKRVCQCFRCGKNKKREEEKESTSE